MAGKPSIESVSPTALPQVPILSPEHKPAIGQFGSFKTTILENVEPMLPQSPFQTLDGLFLPVSSRFFSMFEPRMIGLSCEGRLSGVSAFNHSLLDHMGFPGESHDFFSSWAMVESGLAQPASEEQETLLTEAREFLDSAPDDGSVQAKVTVYKDGKSIGIIPEDDVSNSAFDKLWSFFAQLFTSPFQQLSNKQEQEAFHNTLQILTDRIQGAKTRTVETSEPTTSISGSTRGSTKG